MSLDHLRQVIRNLEIELQDVYDEAYNDGYNDGKDEYAIKTRDQIMATFNHVEGDDQNNNFVRNFTNKDKIKYKLESCPKDIDIDYNGGSNPGWKLSCEVTSYNNNSIKVLINGEYRTFLHKKIREIPKPVIAMVNGFAIGGGHVLHVVCDLTIASENAVFGQTGPKVGSFDGGFGSSYLARHVGQKKAREIWFLCEQYSAKEAQDMGMVNKVVPLKDLENTVLEWCSIMQKRSPLALRMIKRSLNAELDGQHGLMQLAGDATLLYYLTEEAQEGKTAFLEKRSPDFKKYPKFP